MPAALTVRAVTPAEHLTFVRSRPSASFLQLPSWGQVKAGWRAESLGWFDRENRLVGAGLALHRSLPRVRRSLAYLPEGPLLDWADRDLACWLDPMVAHLRRGGAFGVRMGPPVAVRRWRAETVKRALAEGTAKRLGDLVPDVTEPVGDRVAAQLAAAGWRAPGDGHGFAAGQPRFVFQLPLAGRDDDDVLRGMNQLWRRNVRKAERAGVEVVEGGAGDLPAFHALYVETATRDGFTPRPLGYFAGMLAALTAEDPGRLRLYLGRHEGDLVAATLLVQVGEHAWYSYGASSTAKREVRGSNAVQWRMIRDARAAGAAVYDLRGISDGLEPDDPLLGLLQFKLGTGGEAVELLGEWDLPLNRLLYKGFETYLARR